MRPADFPHAGAALRTLEEASLWEPCSQVTRARGFLFVGVMFGFNIVGEVTRWNHLQLDLSKAGGGPLLFWQFLLA